MTVPWQFLNCFKYVSSLNVSSDTRPHVKSFNNVIMIMWHRPCDRLMKVLLSTRCKQGHWYLWMWSIFEFYCQFCCCLHCGFYVSVFIQIQSRHSLQSRRFCLPVFPGPSSLASLQEWCLFWVPSCSGSASQKALFLRSYNLSPVLTQRPPAGPERPGARSRW